MKATTTMRRSCNFCRSRKVRCSGQTICNACSERNIDCVYVKEASKGRPRGSSFRKPSRSVTHDSNDLFYPEPSSTAPNASIFDSSLSSSTSRGHPNSENLGQTQQINSNASLDQGNSLATDLIEMFNGHYKDDGVTGNNEYQNSLVIFYRQVSKDPTSTMDSLLGFSLGERKRRPISYEQLLYTVTQELVEMLSIRFGNLGCYHHADTSARFFAISLAQDHTPTMFEPTSAEEPNPLIDFDSHRTIQMIEVWFSVHPLSNIISKTLLLRSLRSNTHDPLLLAVMLADASDVNENDAAREKKEALFRWAAAKLSSRPAKSCGLSTVQMLMLLGWHELCVSRARRATCYLGYAGRIVTGLKANLAEAPQTGLSQINGIDVSEVETELVRNIYWLVFAVILWSFMQIDQPFAPLLPHNIPAHFPPIDGSSSAVIKLDVVSDNVSTLAKQSRMIQELWPLSHIASTAAQIYALFPREQEAEETSQSICWQDRPLHQLRRLLSLNQNMAVLCLNIRKVLITAVEVLEVKVEDTFSKALVLTAYYTTIIHLLFPRLNPDDSKEKSITVSEELLTDFSTFANRLLEIFSLVDADNESDHLITRMRSSTFADIFVLGLDACGRAIEHFQTRFQEGLELECQNISRRKEDLILIATKMHKISKSETLLTAKNLRLVKKRLKRVKLCFGPSDEPHDELHDTTQPFFMATDMSLSTQGSSRRPNDSLSKAGRLPTAQDMLAVTLDGPFQGLFQPASFPTGEPPKVCGTLVAGESHVSYPLDLGGDGNGHKNIHETSQIGFGASGMVNMESRGEDKMIMDPQVFTGEGYPAPCDLDIDAGLLDFGGDAFPDFKLDVTGVPFSGV